MKVLKKFFTVFGIVFIVLVAVYFLFPGFVISSSATFARISAGLDRNKVSAADHNWVYYDGGNGEAIVFIHGFGLNKDMWGSTLAAFTDRYRVIAPDIAGFGETGYDEALDYGLNSHADRLDQFIRAIGLESFHLAGHSLGGGIAILYASRHPEKIRSLTLMNPFGVKSSVMSDYQKAFDRGENPLLFKTTEGYDLTMSYCMYKPMNMPSHFKTYLAKESEKSYQFYSNAVKNEIDTMGWDMLRKNLRSIKSPTLIIFGDKDRVFDVTCADIFKKEISNSRVSIIKDAGHLVYMDQPEETIKAMDEFLSDTRR